MFANGETVTRLRGIHQADPYSGEETSLSWDSPDTLEIQGCAFDPGTSAEPVTLGRADVVTQPVVYAPYGTDVTAADRLVVRDRTWQVDGDPADWRSPFTGWCAGSVIKLKAVEG